MKAREYSGVFARKLSIVTTPTCLCAAQRPPPARCDWSTAFNMAPNARDVLLVARRELPVTAARRLESGGSALAGDTPEVPLMQQESPDTQTPSCAKAAGTSLHLRSMMFLPP